MATTLQLDARVAPQVQGSNGQMELFGSDDDYYYYDDCDDWGLANKQIRKDLKYAGFDDIDFVKELKDHRVRVGALYEDDGWVYSMRIDRCDGEVDMIKPLYDSNDQDIDFQDSSVNKPDQSSSLGSGAALMARLVPNQPPRPSLTQAPIGAGLWRITKYANRPAIIAP